jgi:hypothetical protein
MSARRIDEAILNAVGERWIKVAMVTARVVDAMGSDLPTGDEGCQLVSQHIEGLVHNGRLAAQGNIKNWRFSEIRRAGDDL